MMRLLTVSHHLSPPCSCVTGPHCGRRFNENAASRHIPACANTVNKPKFLKRGSEQARGPDVMTGLLLLSISHVYTWPNYLKLMLLTQLLFCSTPGLPCNAAGGSGQGAPDSKPLPRY